MLYKVPHEQLITKAEIMQLCILVIAVTTLRGNPKRPVEPTNANTCVKVKLFYFYAGSRNSLPRDESSLSS